MSSHSFEPEIQSESPLWRAVYDELRRLARREMRRERLDHTLQPTALVNEAYLRLIEQRNLDLERPEDFFAIAATVLRRLLVDHARARGRLKRGQGFVRVALDESAPVLWPDGLDALALDEALTALAAEFERAAQVVELKFFAGLSVPDIAKTLGVSPSTVKADWQLAKAWLFRRLRPD